MQRPGEASNSMGEQGTIVEAGMPPGGAELDRGLRKEGGMSFLVAGVSVLCVGTHGAGGICSEMV